MKLELSSEDRGVILANKQEKKRKLKLDIWVLKYPISFFLFD